MYSYIIILLLIYIVLLFSIQKKKENFRQIIKTTNEELDTEIDNLSNTIGHMVTDAYNYIRNKYTTNAPYKPVDENDQFLVSDTKLIPFRQDVIDIIDTTRNRLKSMFGESILDSMDSNYSLYYVKMPNGVIKITRVIYGVASYYYL